MLCEFLPIALQFLTLVFGLIRYRDPKKDEFYYFECDYFDPPL